MLKDARTERRPGALLRDLAWLRMGICPHTPLLDYGWWRKPNLPNPAAAGRHDAFGRIARLDARPQLVADPQAAQGSASNGERQPVLGCRPTASIAGCCESVARIGRAFATSP